MSHTAKMKAVDLHRIPSEAALFACTDTTAPSIMVVRLESDGKNVKAIATDRFCIGVSRADIAGDSFAFSLDIADVKTLVSLAKCTKREAAWREVTFEFKKTTVSFGFNSGHHYEPRVRDGEFIRWKVLFGKCNKMIPRAATGFTADYMGRFAKVQSLSPGGLTDSRRMVVYSFDDNHGRDQRPLIVKMGDNFVALVMPVKLETDGPELVWKQPDWL